MRRVGEMGAPLDTLSILVGMAGAVAVVIGVVLAYRSYKREGSLWDKLLGSRDEEFDQFKQRVEGEIERVKESKTSLQVSTPPPLPKQQDPWKTVFNILRVAREIKELFPEGWDEEDEDDEDDDEI